MQLDAIESSLDHLTTSHGGQLFSAVADHAGIERDLLAAALAEQLIERFASALGGEVPEGDINSADCEDGDAVAAEHMNRALHLPIPGRDVLDGCANQARQNQPVDNCFSGVHSEIAKSLTPADITQLVFKTDQSELQAFPGGGHDADTSAAQAKGNLDDGDFCLDDLHQCFLGSGSKLLAKKPPTKPAPSSSVSCMNGR
ncbi:hypothetical protein D3C87_1304540 [compost metagenome]